MEYTQRLRQAAQAERDAEQTRQQAEARWRQAWWETTLALAVPERKGEVTAALDEAARILGQGRDWLHDRRSAGRAFMGLKPHEISTAPPRLAVAWADAHRGQQATAAVAAELRQAEEAGTTLREYAGKLGQTFETPAREQVRRMAPAERAEVAREVIQGLPPEQAATVAKAALAQPEVADRVLRDREARRTVREADDRYHVDHQQEAKERYELAEPRSAQIGAMTAGEYDLTKARRGFEDALDNAETLERHGWPDESRERFTALTRRAMAAGEALLAKLEGRDLDAELQALLEGGGER